MKTIYVLSDSRGTGLEKKLDPPKGYRALVEIYKGGDLTKLRNMAKQIIHDRPCELVYINAGICAITRKDKRTKEITLDFSDSFDIAHHVNRQLESIDREMRKHNTTPVVFCPIYGVDLNKSNKIKNQAKHSKQKILDNAIPLINSKVTEINEKNHLATPWTASLVHRWHGKRQQNSYGYLGDGVHPGTAALNYIAEQLNTSFEENVKYLQ